MLEWFRRMGLRPRTLSAAMGAGVLLSTAAIAATTINGVPSTISQLAQIVWNDQNISAANPLPTTVTGGSITANQGAPAAQTQANAWPVYAFQGSAPWAISGPVNASQSGTWTVGVSNAFALDATVTARLGTLGQKASSGSAPVVLASDQSTIPTSTSNGATAANQASEIAQLTAANQRSMLFSDFTNQAVAASGTITGPWHDAGTNPSAYTKFNYSFVSSQTGTAVVQVSSDGTNVLTNIKTTTALSPTNNIVDTLPLTYRYYRVVLLNGTTAANVSINTALATN